ncbi:L-fucose mutarotase-like [Oppia nitens]|uniref:L-fucose mutarotase-like n=1 Tax=Oppia nitens TaxID=1686743 RepID=UPI0023DCBA19|nr:L-fucose mutarotase-like [Oppia nitens]
MKRYCLTLDLKDDPKIIAEYERYHRNVWPEIKKSISDSGIRDLEIYRINDRMFMIMETEDNFSFDKKSQMDSNNPKVKEWEELMSNFQKALPFAKPGEKWVLMDRIFKL